MGGAATCVVADYSQGVRIRTFLAATVACITAALLLVALIVPSVMAAPANCTRSDISVRLRLDRIRYPEDQPVDMTMTTKNVSRRRCTMVWPDGNNASIVVRDSDGRKVWDDEACTGYTQAVVEEDWPRGHENTDGARWKQRTQGDPDTCRFDGPLAERGLYFARGIFHGAGGVRSNRVWFRLQP